MEDTEVKMLHKLVISTTITLALLGALTITENQLLNDKRFEAIELELKLFELQYKLDTEERSNNPLKKELKAPSNNPDLNQYPDIYPSQIYDWNKHLT